MLTLGRAGAQKGVGSYLFLGQKWVLYLWGWELVLSTINLSSSDSRDDDNSFDIEPYVHLSWSDLWPVIGFAAASPKGGGQGPAHPPWRPALGLPYIFFHGSTEHH